MRDYVFQHLSKLVNSLGLLCDIIGAILILKFGLPVTVSRTGAQCLLLEGEDTNEILIAKRYDRMAKLGLGLLIIGFAFQLLSNFVTR